MKYRKIESLDSDYRHYLGSIGAYGILFGHKIDKRLQRKATYIWKALLKQYGFGGSVKNLIENIINIYVNQNSKKP